MIDKGAKSMRTEDGYPKRAIVMLLIHEALRPDSDASTWRSRITQAAVNAWFEGHVEAEDRQRGRVSEPTLAGKDECPMPPFPKNDDRLHALIDEAADAFPGMPHLAVVSVAAAAWAAGYREGANCPGCTHRGDTHVRAAMERDGAVVFRVSRR